MKKVQYYRCIKDLEMVGTKEIRHRKGIIYPATVMDVPSCTRSIEMPAQGFSQHSFDIDQPLFKEHFESVEVFNSQEMNELQRLNEKSASLIREQEMTIKRLNEEIATLTQGDIYQGMEISELEKDLYESEKTVKLFKKILKRVL